MLKIFKDSKDLREDYIIIEDEDLTHLKNSLRIRQGEACEIVVGEDLYFTELEIYEDHLKARILKTEKMKKRTQKLLFISVF